MRVFLAGGSGVVGERLVPALAQAGHSVVALTRSPGKADAVRALGAEPAVADALDRDALVEAVRDARPEAVIHQLTAIPDRINIRKISRDFALTNRLRSEGTDNLLDAARAAGARRFLAQSFAGWPYARVGGPVKDEDDPLDPEPPGELRPLFDAIRHLESAVTGASDIEGIVLRYGYFYGPGTAMAAGGTVLEEIRKRRFPIVGSGGGVWSFVHTDDVAAATVAALERGSPGIYNIVDDEPATVSEWLPVVAEAAGA
jgi:nucleoside-diphosphate-sugar epimerase